MKNFAAVYLVVSTVVFAQQALAQGHVFEFAQDSWLSTQEQSESASVSKIQAKKIQTIKKGETWVFPGDTSVMVESPGYLGLLVIPNEIKKGTTKITLRKADEWSSDKKKVSINDLMNDLLQEVSEVQALISLGRAREGLLKIDTTLAKYPQVTYLNLLKASCLVAAGESLQAKVLLESVLKEFPNSVPARDFYNALTGKKVEKKP